MHKYSRRKILGSIGSTGILGVSGCLYEREEERLENKTTEEQNIDKKVFLVMVTVTLSTMCALYLIPM